MDRRAFLFGASAAAVAVALPLPAIAVQMPAPAAEPLLAFAVGPSGEFGWRPIYARSIEEAWRLYASEFLSDDEIAEALEDMPWGYDEECIQRCPSWDGRDAKEIKSVDWIVEGMGHTCERCDSETYAHDGATIVGDQVVCEDCMTIADYLTIGDLDEVENLLHVRLDGAETRVEAEGDARDYLTERGILEQVIASGVLAKVLDEFPVGEVAPA